MLQSASWVMPSPLFFVMRRRYRSYEPGVAAVYVFVFPRPLKVCAVCVSTVVHVVPSVEPSSVHADGSRPGASLALVSEYARSVSGWSSR
ncbi:hypothetical protein DEJ15_04050 [Curtobacterium sp. MCJR17_043]|nr:hypothetical protein [Curtobacterium sp. MCJR17_043]WIB36339.1 hypothetical protein DEJ15_04050 [Curtobacterium sp. MCJR17_043]